MRLRGGIGVAQEDTFFCLAVPLLFSFLDSLSSSHSALDTQQQQLNEGSGRERRKEKQERRRGTRREEGRSHAQTYGDRQKVNFCHGSYFILIRLDIKRVFRSLWYPFGYFRQQILP